VMSNFTVFAKNFGQRVVELRKKQGLTQEELADKAEVERSYMGAIERGERNPTLVKVFQLSRALGILPKDLFDF